MIIAINLLFRHETCSFSIFDFVVRKSAVSFLGVFICLFGSEVTAKAGKVLAQFLSCLFGSEDLFLYAPNLSRFLSCLFGSEENRLQKNLFAPFLSCLFGSEVLYLLYTLDIIYF